MSINGSPLRPETSDVDAEAEIETETINEEEEGDSDSDDELPDPKAYEAKLNKSQTAGRKGRTGKRGLSLLFRQSLAPTKHGKAESAEDVETEMASIPLKDGRVISFNPLALDPDKIEVEMRESGLADAEREVVRAQIREEVVRALSERMKRWSGLGP